MALPLASTSRMQWESYRSFWVAYPAEAEQGLRVFLAKARAEGLTQVKAVRWDSLIVVVATRPGDREGHMAFV